MTTLAMAMTHLYEVFFVVSDNGLPIVKIQGEIHFLYWPVQRDRTTKDRYEGARGG